MTLIEINQGWLKPEKVGHNHVPCFIVWKLPYISVCASRGLIIDSGMIILTYNNYILLKFPGVPMLGYLIQTSEYHVILLEAKDNYAAMQESTGLCIHKSKSCTIQNRFQQNDYLAIHMLHNYSSLVRISTN